MEMGRWAFALTLLLFSTIINIPSKTEAAKPQKEPHKNPAYFYLGCVLSNMKYVDHFAKIIEVSHNLSKLTDTVQVMFVDFWLTVDEVSWDLTLPLLFYVMVEVELQRHLGRADRVQTRWHNAVQRYHADEPQPHQNGFANLQRADLQTGDYSETAKTCLI
jgi:hypothetical protein